VEAGTNYRDLTARKRAVAPNILHIFFVCADSAVIFRLYTMVLSDAAKVTLQLFSEKMFSPSWRARNKIFLLGPEALYLRPCSQVAASLKVQQL
jgi:hypothetical protein